MKKRMFITLVCAVLALGLVGGVTSVLAKGKPQPEPEPVPQIHIQTDLPMPASLHVSSTADGCSNSTGPWITLDGEMTLAGIGTKLIFRNNAKGTHEADTYTESGLVIIPQGGMIKMPKQPVLGGVGGNPWIYMQFYDSAGYEISEEYLLGRCVQGLSAVNLDFSFLTHADVYVTGEGCTNQGPNITLSGEMALGGIDAALRFRNNAKGTHEYDEYTEVKLVIIPEGESYSLPKQPPLGGAGGNPLVSLQFVDGDWGSLSEEYYLGRCNKLGS